MLQPFRLAAIAAILWLSHLAMIGRALALPSYSGPSASVIHVVDVLGDERRYMVHIPPGAPDKPLPAVVVLHGNGGTPFQIESYMAFDAAADRDGFIAVYPEGKERYWNDVRFVDQREITKEQAAADVAFLNVLADDLVKKGLAEPGRIFLTGVSNGGFMVTTMACLSPKKFAAFAPVVATAPVLAREMCKPGKLRPMLIINGTGDPMTVWDSERAEKIGYLGGDDFFALWSRLNGCSGREETALTDADPTDNSDVFKVVATACPAGGDTELYRVEGGGHHPPTLEQRPSGTFRGQRNHDIEAAEVIWAFFKRFTQ